MKGAQISVFKAYAKQKKLVKRMNIYTFKFNAKIDLKI